jgi:hypothetical protein
MPSASSILPSSVMTVRPRETTWPVTRITAVEEDDAAAQICSA